MRSPLRPALTAHLALVISLLVLSAEGFAKHSDSVQEIPFTLYRNHLVVAVGSLGGSEQRHLLIDTGTNVSMVDFATAREIGLDQAQGIGNISVIDGIVQTYYAILPAMDLGPIHRRSMTVGVGNLSWLLDEAGVRIDGVIGLDALAPLNFQIDYQMKKLRFGAIRIPRPTVSVVQAHGLLMVPALLNGARVKLMLDTGGSNLILFASTLPKSVVGSTVRTTARLSNLAGETELQKLPVKQLRIGEMNLNVSLALVGKTATCPDIQGILGISASHFKRIAFDFQRGEVGFELQDAKALDFEAPAYQAALVRRPSPMH
jgi:predicted aspartyl protease